MSTYVAPLRDMQFVIKELVGLADITAMPDCAEVTEDLVDQVLTEAGKFAAEVLDPLNTTGDRQGAKYIDSQVSAPPGFSAAYRQFIEARAEAAAVIREVFPKRLEARAVSLAKRESKLVATSYTSCCVGLFQINWWAHKSWLKDFGVTKASQLLDARTNARAALEMYKRSGGWSPWHM